MPTITSVLTDYCALTKSEQKTVRAILLSSAFGGSNLRGYIDEERFVNGRVCPHCGATHVVRNGKHPNGTQRYKCMDCGKRFVGTTNSIAFGSRKDITVWENYIHCMLLGCSLSTTADFCGISVNTAFIWRHKILDVLKEIAEKETLDGIVEADETFFPVSYKGNHKSFKMPREPRKHGLKVKKRGLSNEQVCVASAVNRSGHSIAKVSNLARIKGLGLQAVYGGRIDPGTNIITDSASAYKKFAADNGLVLHQVKSGKHIINGIYHIQHINSYHSHLKTFMKEFRGVSTKYLNNYVIWYDFVKYQRGSYDDKRDRLMSKALSTIFTERNIDINRRPTLPLLA